MPTKIVRISEFKCVQCNKIFSIEKQYVEAIVHSRTWNHDLKSIEIPVSEEEDAARGEYLRKKFYAELNAYEGPTISQENLDRIKAVKNGTYVPETKPFDDSKYGSVDI